MENESENESFLRATNSSFLRDIGISGTTLEAFDTFLKSQRPIINEEEVMTPQYIGGICLQQFIINKLNTFDREKKNISPEQYSERLLYFRGKAFIDNFVDNLPVRDSIDKTAAETSYTGFFNKLFNVSYKDWRDEKFSRVDNQNQCRRALGIPAGQNIAQLQEIGNKICYICGKGILSKRSGQSTMECEHVLPIISALSHWWLVKAKRDFYTEHELEDLAVEYDWSHRCCNRIKENFDFVIYDPEKLKYRVNMEIIDHILQEIKVSDKFDCDKIKNRSTIDKVEQGINIARRIQKMVNKINKTMKYFDHYSEYLLLTKYKVLSALTDDDFLAAILGDNNNEESEEDTSEGVTTSAPAKSATTKSSAKTSAKSSAKSAPAKRVERSPSAKRKLKVLKSIQSIGLMRGGSKSLKKLMIGGAYKILTKINFDAMTDEEIKEFDILTEIDPSIIAKYILNKDKYSPTLTEFKDKYEEIFVQRAHTRFGSHGSSHTYFDDLPEFTEEEEKRGRQTGMLPIGSITTNESLKNDLVRDAYPVLTDSEIRKGKNDGSLPKGYIGSIFSFFTSKGPSKGGKKTRKNIKNIKKTRKIKNNKTL